MNYMGDKETFGLSEPTDGSGPISSAAFWHPQRVRSLHGYRLQYAVGVKFECAAPE